MRLLFSSQIAAEVELLRGLLDEAGIATEVRNESIYPNLPGAAFQPEIWVLNDSDYERACELRDAWRKRRYRPKPQSGWPVYSSATS